MLMQTYYEIIDQIILF